jgi:histidine phosphotransferase ChpT
MAQTRTKPNETGLAHLVAVRLCHDLGGASGALTGALELLEGEGDDALGVARDAARILDRRIRFFRAAIGGGLPDGRAADLASLAEGLTLGRRVGIDLSGIDPATILPGAAGQALLLALWVGVDALPRGGVLRTGGDLAHGLSILPDGPHAAWPWALSASLSGQDVTLTPKLVVVPLLVAAAALARLRLDLPLSTGGSGAAPLLLLPG